MLLLGDSQQPNSQQSTNEKGMTGEEISSARNVIL